MLGKTQSASQKLKNSIKMKELWAKGKIIRKDFEPWNKGLNKNNDIRILNFSNKLFGKKFSEDHLKKLSLSHIGQKAWNKGLQTSKTKKWYHRLRKTKKYYEWRIAVFERDNYTCQICNTRGGYLEPHHIVSIKEDKKKALVINNGMTLCKECHKKITWAK